ncbi:MAG: iron-containing alcohol dehydrogenase [Nitrospirae bacterium]|jgi:alcohol dehydrogenase class IV|nr:iron-containing alcohol dehydrogenase [Nitrospirota bacterium]
MIPGKMFEVMQPVRVMFGQGQITKLGEVAKTFGNRICLITMKELVDLGLIEHAIAPLKKQGLEVLIIDQAKPEPTCSDIDELVTQVRAANPNVLVAFGGGSVMDVAKAVAIGVTHPEPIWMYVNLSNRPPLPIGPNVLPVIAIPTTSGTGAEVTPYAVLSNEDSIQKGTIKSPLIFPKIAIIDPEITLSLPRHMTLLTGIDAFAHATESYVNQVNRTPFSDLVASEAINVIYRGLPQLIGKLDSVDLRTQLAWGSMLAGVAIANAGTTVAHALAQPLGAHTHLPHSLTVAIFTLPVLRHTWSADIERFAGLKRCLHGESMNAGSVHTQAQEAVEMIDSWMEGLELVKSFPAIEKSDDLEERLLGDVLGYMSRPLAQHPKKFSEQELQEIIQEALGPLTSQEGERKFQIESKPNALEAYV